MASFCIDLKRGEAIAQMLLYVFNLTSDIVYPFSEVFCGEKAPVLLDFCALWP